MLVLHMLHYNYTLCFVLKYSQCTVQLSSKVTFAHVSDASRTHSGRAPVWQKRGVALMYFLLQLYREVLHLHGRILRASQMHLAHVSDVCGRYLVAELYCSYIAIMYFMINYS